jgi:aubergine-like protein
MIPHVFDYELRQIRDALKAINADKPPSLSFTIVTKRVNARFFSKSDQRFENPIPGTIIDSVVTREKRYDFYLISQSVRQGTVTPTMYNIIWDESSLKPTHHQQLAYKLTHLYFNWAVSHI